MKSLFAAVFLTGGVLCISTAMADPNFNPILVVVGGFALGLFASMAV